ncbi:ABC-type antimicrobial peptide transport system permease subunit [Bradyrhizobium sp. AZCC 2176]
MLAVTHHKAVSGHEKHMKIALLALLGLALGVLGGATLGIGTGLAWVQIFKTSSFGGYSGMLVFFTFMPLGAAIGGIGGALLFGIIAIRDAEIAIEREPVPRHDR